MKIVLGTVQCDLKYGIINKKGIPSNKEFKDILSVTKEYYVNILYSDSQYGNAEKRVG